MLCCCAPRQDGRDVVYSFDLNEVSVLLCMRQPRKGEGIIRVFHSTAFEPHPVDVHFGGNTRKHPPPITPLSRSTKRYTIINPREGLPLLPKTTGQMQGRLPICLQVDPGLKSLFYDAILIK